VPLALVHRAGGGVQDVVDLRPLFPPLTHIEAEDVGFDNSRCALGATVQEALETLCMRGHEGKCSILVRTAAELQAAVAGLNAGQNVVICVPEGTIVLDRQVRIAGMRHVALSGVGRASLITTSSGEPALLFENCSSVSLTDLSVNGGPVGEGGELSGRRGAITAVDCYAVELDRVTAACRPGWHRSASCVAIHGVERRPKVRIRDCRFNVGFAQVGLQIVSPGRVVLENNEIGVREVPQDVALRWLRADPRLVRLVAKGMYSYSGSTALAVPLTAVAAPAVAAPAGAVTLSLGATRQSVQIASHPALEEAWAGYAEFTRTLQFASPAAARSNVASAAEAAIRNAGVVSAGGRNFNGFNAFVDEVSAGIAAFAAEGIVIAGDRVGEAQIVGNEILGVQDGIRIAASSSQDPEPPNWQRSEPPNVVERAVVERNRVELRPPGVTVASSGIFVGHFRSLVAARNEVSFVPPIGQREADWTGIRTYGYRGPLMRIVENAVNGAYNMLDISPALKLSIPTHWDTGHNNGLGNHRHGNIAPGVTMLPN
jgi:hypothetical protein